MKLSISPMFARMLPFSLGSMIARRLLKVLGFGAGTDVGSSGEISAMKRALALTGRKTSDQLLMLDVGANVGDWTNLAFGAFPKARIIAFEPSETHRAAFRQNVAKRETLSLEVFALAAERRTATLYKDMSISGLASLTKRDLSHVGIDLNLTEQVQTERLDSFLEEHGDVRTIDYLKLDVEGHELDVLKGAQQALADGRIKVVQFEFGGSNIDTRTYFRDFYTLLTGLGYRIYIIRPGGLLAPIDRYREFYEQFRTTNFVAVLNRRGTVSGSPS